MGKSLDKRYSELLEQEKLFIKRVVYYIHAYTPRPWWHSLIPFRFLMEYLARKRDVRSFTETHLYLKQLALAMAYKDAKSGIPGQSDAELQAQLRDYCMHMQKTSSPRLHEGLSEWMNLLKQHYLKLLSIEEKYYILLLQNAYGTREVYEDFLGKLTRAEREIDQAILDVHQQNADLVNYIQRKQKAFAAIRERDVREAFGE